MKQTTEQVLITVENLHKQKLSDVFESVLDDINRVTKKGIGLNMGAWVSPENCTVCLGGAAISGFLTPKCLDINYANELYMEVGNGEFKVDGVTATDKQSDRLQSMMFMFDSWRNGFTHLTFDYWEEVTNKHLSLKAVNKTKLDWEKAECIKNFRGFTDKDKLSKSIRVFVVILRKHGL